MTSKSLSYNHKHQIQPMLSTLGSLHHKLWLAISEEGRRSQPSSSLPALIFECTVNLWENPLFSSSFLFLFSNPACSISSLDEKEAKFAVTAHKLEIAGPVFVFLAYNIAIHYVMGLRIYTVSVGWKLVGYQLLTKKHQSAIIQSIGS